jgi:hypothetical protein
MESVPGTATANNRFRAVTGFVGMAVISMVALVASTELHEFFHFIVGRQVGLPSHFLSLTSAGVDPSVAAHAPPYALALMNGVAPLATMVVGVLALAVAPGRRPRAPAAVTDFLGWCAIFAVPYIGIQTMLTAAPIELRGSGADFAAVFGGYFGLSAVPRTAISIVGLMIYMASGYSLCAAVSQRTDSASLHLTVKQRLRELAAWRLVAAVILGLFLIAMTIRSAAMLAHGDGRGVSSLFREMYVWAMMMALLVRWSAPGAREVRDHWIFPGLLSSAGLIAIGFLPHLDDFFFLGTVLVLPLTATAWRASRSNESALRPEG